MLCWCARIISAFFRATIMLSEASAASISTLRYVCTSPLASVTITGMVLFSSSTFSTRLRSVSLPATLRLRIASAHISIRLRSSWARSFTRKWLTMSEAPAINTAAVISVILTCRILSVQNILEVVGLGVEVRRFWG